MVESAEERKQAAQPKNQKPLPAPETHVGLTQTAPGNVPAPIRAPKDVAFPRAFISRNGGSAKSDIPLPTM